jgi:hypothetical protein
MFGSKNGRVNLVIGTVGVFRVEQSLMMIRNWGDWIESDCQVFDGSEIQCFSSENNLCHDFFMELLVWFVYLESDSELTVILGRDIWF